MELNQKIIDVSYKLMEYKTKNYQWYHDTSEKPFIYSEGSIWLINPETREWFLEIKKTGEMNYFYDKFDDFYKFINLNRTEFEVVLKKWVEDMLKKSITLTNEIFTSFQSKIKRTENNNVVKYEIEHVSYKDGIEDVLEKGIVVSFYDFNSRDRSVNEVIDNGINKINSRVTSRSRLVEDVFRNGNTIKNQEI